MTRTALFLFTAASIFSAPYAMADYYTCKDGQGHTTTSDRPIPECKDKTTQVYTDTGTLKKQFSNALPPEQQRAADLQGQQREKELQQQEMLKKEQLYLTTHYPSEQDVEVARHKALSEVRNKIAVENHLIDEVSQQLIRNQNEQKLIPQNETNKMIDARSKEFSLAQTIKQSNVTIQKLSAEETKLNRQFDAIHKHYVEVVTQSAK